MLSRLFAAAQGIFHELHDVELLARKRIDTPVISVGNLVAGGTGKTVLIDWLANHLADHHPGVACRGYRAGPDGINDEMKVLSKLHPALPIEAAANRYQAVKRLRQTGCQVILLDDGFQHRRLHRDLDIVILDATDPFSGDYLPFGRRRESPPHLTRADLVCLSHADALQQADLEALRQQIQKLAGCPVLAARHVMLPPLSATGAVLPPQPVHLLAGVAKPRHVISGLAALGYRTVETTFPGDHLVPNAKNLRRVQESKLPIVCTLKDAVKNPSGTWWTIGVKWEFMDHQRTLEDRLRRLLGLR